MLAQGERNIRLRSMSWNVLITAGTISQVGQAALDLLRNSGCEVTVPERPGPFSGEALLRHLKGMDAVLATVDGYSGEALRDPALNRLKIISRWGVGYDSIDVPAATEQGIVIAYTPGLLDETVADYTFALLFAVARRVHESHLAMREGAWKRVWGHDVSGKTLGIVGCGRIGRAVARRASGFRLRVLGYDVAPHPEAEALGIEFVSLDELLGESDFVTLHAALTSDNRRLISEPQLREMKTGAYLINAARGALVDEPALIRALEEGWIAGAALDAFTVEPLPADDPLRQAPNLLLTSHQASYGRETGREVSLVAAQAIIDLMNGRPPALVVNPDVFEAKALRAKLA